MLDMQLVNDKKIVPVLYTCTHVYLNNNCLNYIIFATYLEGANLCKSIFSSI